MTNLFPGTDIEIGKWYPAMQRPPILEDYESTDPPKYELLLGIKDLGTRPGFYTSDDDTYSWHCERYDSFDDEHIPGWTREQEINNNLELVYETARGVSCWMIIVAFDNDLPSFDGTNYYDLDPGQKYGTADPDDDTDEDDDEDDDNPFAAGNIIPLHLN